MEASRRQFACANPEKSQKTKNKLNTIIQDEQRKLDFDRAKTNPVPTFLVRVTTLSIKWEKSIADVRFERLMDVMSWW